MREHFKQTLKLRQKKMDDFLAKHLSAPQKVEKASSAIEVFYNELNSSMAKLVTTL
jgi:hypothetical protein